MHAVLAGATGLVGRECLHILLARSEYTRVTALTRRPLNLENAKLHEAPADFNGLTLPPTDHVFCALGTTIRKAGSQEAFRKVDLEYVVALARAAKRAGARGFAVVSSVGADARSSNFYLRTKGEMEEQVRAVRFESLHIFRPSFLAGDRVEYRLPEKIGIGVARALQFTLIGPLRKYRPIHARTAAEAMVSAVLQDVKGVHVHEYESIIALAS